MKQLLYLLTFCLLLASCRSSRVVPAALKLEQPSPAIGVLPEPVPVVETAPPPKTAVGRFITRVVGKKSGQKSGNQKFKNSTVIYNNAPNTSTAVAGKKAGPLIQADSGSTVQVAEGKGDGPVGNAGRDQKQEAVTTKESWFRPLLPYIGGALLLGLLYSFLPFLPVSGAGWLWALMRRRR